MGRTIGTCLGATIGACLGAGGRSGNSCGDRGLSIEGELMGCSIGTCLGAGIGADDPPTLGTLTGKITGGRSGNN